MNGIAMKTTIGVLMATLLLTARFATAAAEVEVTAADPPAAPPGTVRLDVTISGSGFDGSAKVYFLKAGTEELGDVVVNNARTVNANQIIANIDIPEAAADQQEYDIEVQMSRGRGGKGTTLFKVDSTFRRSECMLDFRAEFDALEGDVPLPGDGLYGDGLGYYDAFGGRGFRLDTNGSQQLERSGDYRHVMIDFSVDSVAGCKSGGPNDDYTAEHAAGFCGPPIGEKGIDLRFEHEQQDLDVANPGGLCSMQPGESRHVAVRVGFLGEPDGALKSVFKNGRVNGNGGPTSLFLTYGCLATYLLQADADPEGLAVVTRSPVTNPDGSPVNVWRIEGSRACLHTYLGHKLEDAAGTRILLRIPFGLTIEDVDIAVGGSE